MQAGLTDTILGLLSSMDWTTDLAGLQKAAALGDAQHVHTVRALHQETRQGLADILYRYSAYRSPRVFGDKFCDKFGDQFGDSPYFVINLVTMLVTHFVSHHICHNFW